MRPRCFALLLLTIAFVPAAAHACESMKPYLDELAAGRRPSSPPVIDHCDKLDSGQIAAAFTAFIRKPASVADVNAVIEELQAAYEEKESASGFKALAAALETSLPKYKRNSGDYALLDNLPDYVAEIYPQPKAPKPEDERPHSLPRPPAVIRADDDPFPWVSWTLLGVAILLIPIPFVLAVRFFRRSIAEAKANHDELARNFGRTFDKSLQLVDGQLRATAGALEAKAGAISLLEVRHVDALAGAVGGLREDLGRVAQTVEDLATAPPRSAADPVALERQILAESWKQFRANAALSAMFDEAVAGAPWEPLLGGLPKCIPPDLQPSFDAVYAPCKQHSVFVQKLSLVQRIVDHKQPRLANDAEELRRTRELEAILNAAQNSGDGSNPLNFRFKRWVTDTFLPFADLYLQRCQQADLEKRGRELAPGANLVRQLLQLASIEPIDLKLGETQFDSTRHIGRATSNDPHYPDGVITGVVRNGFIEGGQQVIRQPEVVVNRMR